MKLLDMAEATGTLAEYASRVNDETVVVTVGGKPVAALVAVSNVDKETISLATNPNFMLDILERSQARAEKEGWISSGEMRRRLGLKS
jgi:prevent-host-death family protein